MQGSTFFGSDPSLFVASRGVNFLDVFVSRRVGETHTALHLYGTMLEQDSYSEKGRHLHYLCFQSLFPLKNAKGFYALTFSVLSNLSLLKRTRF